MRGFETFLDGNSILFYYLIVTHMAIYGIILIPLKSFRGAGDGWTESAVAYPGFGRLVNVVEAALAARCITTCPPGFR